MSARSELKKQAEKVGGEYLFEDIERVLKQMVNEVIFRPEYELLLHLVRLTWGEKAMHMLENITFSDGAGKTANYFLGEHQPLNIVYQFLYTETVKVVHLEGHLVSDLEEAINSNWRAEARSYEEFLFESDIELDTDDIVAEEQLVGGDHVFKCLWRLNNKVHG